MVCYKLEFAIQKRIPRKKVDTIFNHQYYIMHHSDVQSLTNVTSHKGDDQLLSFAALTAGLGNNILVEQLHSSLEAGELHHGVGDLPHPQGHYTLIETRVEDQKRRY